MFQKKNTKNYSIYNWTIKRVAMNCLSKNGNGVISKIQCDIHDSKGMKEN